MAVYEIICSIALIILALCSSHAHCRGIHAPRGERDVTGEGEESSLDTDLGESLRTVCVHTQTAFLHDIQPLTLHGGIEPRWQAVRFRDPFWSKPVKSEAHHDSITFNSENFNVCFTSCTVSKITVTCSNFCAGSSGSICAGLNYTCCKLSAEKTLQSVIFKEYREILHDVLQSEYLRSCPSIGRESYRKNCRLVITKSLY